MKCFQKLDFCLFLVPITSPEKISCVSFCLIWGAFPLDFGFLCCLWGQYEKASQRPNTTCHWLSVTCHSHEQKSVVCTWSGENLPVPPETLISEESLLGLILISSEQVQADSNTSSIVVWMISGENRVAEENRPKSHLLMSTVSKQRPTCF